jgi:hypothetical protein
MKKPDFQKHAENEFRFLVERFGFTSKYTVNEDKSYPERSVERVQYTSENVMVEVSYSGRSEIAVTLDQNPPSYRFELSLFLQAFHPDVWRTLGDGIAYSDEDVRRELERLSDALQRYGKPLLEHDRQVFEKMKTFKWWEQPS